MKREAYKAIIVEGAQREQSIIKNILSIYFRIDRFKIITLSAEQNIYMLWQRMKADFYETDVIEVVREYSKEARKLLEDYTREDFSDVFLFFDYDGHQKNLPEGANGEDVLKEMLETFDNETENGKLYVSYPMVEALRDFIPGQCEIFTKCIWHQNKLGDYKNRSGINNPYNAIKEYNFESWQDIIGVFAMRISCLFEKRETMTFEEYRHTITPLTVYEQQNKYIEQDKVFVLSGLPEFLLDYFKIDFWRKHVKFSKFRFKSCIKNAVIS